MGDRYITDSAALSTMSASVLGNLSSQIAKMGQDDAKAYIQSFEKVMQSSGADADIASYLSTVNWSSMTEAVEAMEYLNQKGLDPSIVKEYWEVATDGANTYVASMQEALGLVERF
jgi:hypothetical protein